MKTASSSSRCKVFDCSVELWNHKFMDVSAIRKMGSTAKWLHSSLSHNGIWCAVQWSGIRTDHLESLSTVLQWLLVHLEWILTGMQLDFQVSDKTASVLPKFFVTQDMKFGTSKIRIDLTEDWGLINRGNVDLYMCHFSSYIRYSALCSLKKTFRLSYCRKMYWLIFLEVIVPSSPC